LALNVQTLLNGPVIKLASTDSTNNYAMRLIDADTAQPGTTILAGCQTAGRGQRGRQWADIPGQSLLMSLVVTPLQPLEQQFYFNASIAVSIAAYLKTLNADWQVFIKWPNDIILNDKKAAGVLIENLIRGSRWTHAIIGLGLNVAQPAFPAELPHATSLLQASGQYFEPDTLAIGLRRAILEAVASPDSDILGRYNELLYRKDKLQAFSAEGRERWMATLRRVLPSGYLEVELPGGTPEQYAHGAANWVWP
jgi:BirA family biotin operon repressor/biotin-[acetyl-CoA-carboxylase] ligase